MADQENLKFNGQQWLDIYEERLLAALVKLNVGDSGDLANSFIKTALLNSDGDVSRLQLSFLMYGRFRDMGVGKYNPLGHQHEKNIQLFKTKFTRTRHAARWYSKTTTREIALLAEMLQEQFGINLIHSVESNMPQHITTISI